MNSHKRKFTGADAILKTLIEYGKVETVFGYPGGAALPLYDSLDSFKNKINHILVRHEQGAGFMAQGYARSSQELGVSLVTSGPGFTNIITPMADANMDGVPLLVISGQVPKSSLGTNAFQEVDAVGISRHISKYSVIVNDVKDIVYQTIKCIHLALCGRKGVVHIDIPKDIQKKVYHGGFHYQEYEKRVIQQQKTNYFQERNQGNDLKISKCKELIKGSKKPIILVGQGVKYAQAEKELKEFIENTGIPAVWTLLAKGVLPDTHNSNLGMLGMHGFYHANMAMDQADLIINIGSRFDDRIVGNYESFGKNAKIIQVSIDSKEIDKLVSVYIGMNQDAKDFLNGINKHKIVCNIASWKKQIEAWKKEFPYHIDHSLFGAKQVLKTISDLYEDSNEIIYGVDVGQHQMWGAHILKVLHGSNWLSSGGFGSMGFSLPACIGAAMKNPSKKVISFSGDGGIQMNIQELALLQEYPYLDIKVVILDNGYLGMVRQWQELFHDNRYSGVTMKSPNFSALGELYNIPCYTITNMKENIQHMEEIFKKKGPAIIWYKIEKEENVFPMVAPGQSLGDTRIS